jgi:hypothetical protein
MKTYRNVKLSTDVEENLMFDEIDLDDELEFSEEGMEEI